MDSLFIYSISAGISLGIVLPGLTGIVLIIFASLKLFLKHKIIQKDKLRRFIIISICIASLIFVSLESLIISSAYSKKHEYTQTNYVIVLGCGIFSDGRLTLTLQKRLNAAYNYLIKYPETQCIVSGGQGPNEPFPESNAMREYLIEKGIDKNRILQEDKSTSTRENLIFSYDIIKQSEKEPTIAIATSDFHIFRAKMLAKRYGMEAIGLPCHTSWYLLLNSYLREFFALVKSFVFD